MARIEKRTDFGPGPMKVVLPLSFGSGWSGLGKGDRLISFAGNSLT
jgi:hypothetical protein